jgi:O-antigen/teichoic acid export membrane protein
MKDLKTKTLRGGVARLCTLAANFLLRILSVTILARLLSPKDFGLVGMVTAFTGVLNLFRDFGLSAAAIQRETVRDEEISTLFWINLAVGMVLAILSFAAAPMIAGFYHEPRLSGVTAALAFGFLFNSAGVQHGAMLQREMRFTALSVIGTVSAALGTAIAIMGALAGYGYWSLVAMTVATPLIATVGSWLATSWIPGLPRRYAGLRSTVHFGGTVTLQGLLIYLANNFEKVLLGRFWGADAIGIYGRAYQLSNIPTENLNSTIGEVAFAALSRLQNQPDRLKSYFLKGYSLVLSVTLPITIASALFADDIIATLLGPKWQEAVPVFRFLAPTILVFGIANPLGWLLCSIGKVGRLLKMSLVITPIMIGSYLVAVRYGPKGVAFTYSLLMLLWVVPTIVWGVYGTVVSIRDVLAAVMRPLISASAAGGLAFAARSLFVHLPLPKLIPEGAVFAVLYTGFLLYVMNQKSLYLDLWRDLWRHRMSEPETAIAEVG